MVGLSQYAFGAAAAPIVGVAGRGSVGALSVTLLGFAVTGTGAALIALRSSRPAAAATQA